MARGIGLKTRLLRGALLVLLGAGLASGLPLAQPGVDANRASLADIERVQGIGTTVAATLIHERNKAPFKDWNDLIRRVKGIGAANAARLSAQGLVVNGAGYRGAPPGEIAPAASAASAAPASPSRP